MGSNYRKLKKTRFTTVRIASSAMIISKSHPDKSMLIAEACLQSVGLSPLLFEVSLVLLRWYVYHSRFSMTRGSAARSWIDKTNVRLFAVAKPENTAGETRNGPCPFASHFMVSDSQSLSPLCLRLSVELSTSDPTEKLVRWCWSSHLCSSVAWSDGCRLNVDLFFLQRAAEASC